MALRLHIAAAGPQNLLGKVQVKWSVSIRNHIHNIADGGNLILSPLRLQDFMKGQEDTVNLLAFHARTGKLDGVLAKRFDRIPVVDQPLEMADLIRGQIR